ncbi:MAG: hypothetical protein Alpg2KO_17950 [Alphaproteobacteria bacterium]
MRHAITKRLDGKSGASGTGYALLVGLIGIIALAAITQIGEQIDDMFVTVSGTTGAASGQGSGTNGADDEVLQAAGCNGFSIPSDWSSVYVSASGSADGSSCGAIEAPCNLVGANAISSSPAGEKTAFIAINNVTTPTPGSAFVWQLHQSDQAVCSAEGSVVRVESAFSIEGENHTFSQVEIGPEDGVSIFSMVNAANRSIDIGDLVFDGVTLYGYRSVAAINVQSAADLVVTDSSFLATSGDESFDVAINVSHSQSNGQQVPEASIDVSGTVMENINQRFVSFFGATSNANDLADYKVNIHGSNNWTGTPNTGLEFYFATSSHNMLGSVDISVSGGLDIGEVDVTRRPAIGVSLTTLEPMTVRAAFDLGTIRVSNESTNTVRGFNINVQNGTNPPNGARADVDITMVNTAIDLDLITGKSANTPNAVFINRGVQQFQTAGDVCIDMSGLDMDVEAFSSNSNGIDVIGSHTDPTPVEIVRSSVNNGSYAGASSSQIRTLLQQDHYNNRGHSFAGSRFRDPNVYLTDYVYMGNVGTVTDRTTPCDQPSP